MKNFLLVFAFLMTSLHAEPSSFPTPPKAVETKEKEKVKEENEEEIVLFTPPTGWMLADPNALPGRVRTMVVGKGASSFPPSINLSTEPYKGTLKQYLKIVKNMNVAQGHEWKDLGTIQTQAGVASLSQVDTKSQWGVVRLMHVILVKNGNVYILTASALKDEFSVYYKDFFASMRSLRIFKDPYEMITDTQLRTQLRTATDKIKTQWQTLLVQKQKENPEMSPENVKEAVFDSDDFQKTIWNPFKEMLKDKYKQFGEEWQSLFLQKLEDQLFMPN